MAVTVQKMFYFIDHSTGMQQQLQQQQQMVPQQEQKQCKLQDQTQFKVPALPLTSQPPQQQQKQQHQQQSEVQRPTVSSKPTSSQSSNFQTGQHPADRPPQRRSEVDLDVLGQDETKPEQVKSKI